MEVFSYLHALSLKIESSNLELVNLEISLDRKSYFSLHLNVISDFINVELKMDVFSQMQNPFYLIINLNVELATSLNVPRS